MLDIDKPRILITAPRGKSGKTIVTLCIALSIMLKYRLKVQLFKVGPDFIDPTYHSSIVGRPSRNLDPYLQDPQKIINRFITYSKDSDIAIIEGVFGLYDSPDRETRIGETEIIARLLKTPIILVLDAERINKSISAIVRGFKDYSKVNIRGIVITGIVKEEQFGKIERIIEKDFKDIEIIGYIPKNVSIEEMFKYRHLGLVPTLEKGTRRTLYTTISEVSKKLDVEKILKIANEAEVVRCVGELESFEKMENTSVNIGIILDRAFTFYYPEVLELCINYSSKTYILDSMESTSIPDDVDLLVIGGGFPEVWAGYISSNRSFLKSVYKFYEDNKFIYAECGGLMFLTDCIIHNNSSYNMCGIFEACTYMLNRPVGHGYVVGEAINDNLVCPRGSVVRGHEFHHSKIYVKDRDVKYYLKLIRGRGIGNGLDGLMKRNTYAQYMHIHPSSYNHIYYIIKYIMRMKSACEGH